MAEWDTEENGNLVPRADAFPLIKDKATESGIKGAFKVFYDDNMVATPDDLPEMVDMDLVRVSETLDQASSWAV